MDWLTQSRGELFKDKGQDAKRQFGEMEAWLSAQTDVKGRGDAACVDALQQDLDLVVGQSQKCDWEATKPNRGSKVRPEEQLGTKTQKEEEIQESTCFMWQILSSFQVVFLLCIHQNRLCSAAERWSPNVSHTHTHHNLQMFVISEALARAPSGTCSFRGRKKRETRESHLGFSCLHSEVTQEIPPTIHWPAWVTER